MGKKTLKVQINDFCTNCGTCGGIDPEHFYFDPSKTKAIVLKQEIDKITENLDEAIKSCPEGAISVISQASDAPGRFQPPKNDKKANLD